MNTDQKYIDIVFDGPPAHESGRFIEVENAAGASIRNLEQYLSTEVVIYRYGVEIAREYGDSTWYDTISQEEITEEEAEDYL